MKRADLIFTAALVPLDALTLLAAASAAYALRFTPWLEAIRAVSFALTFREYISAVLYVIPFFLLIFALLGLYRTTPPRLAVELTRIIPAVASGIAVVLAIAFVSRELFESRFILFAAWIIATIFLMVERLVVRMVQKFLRHHGIGVHMIVMLGDTSTTTSYRTFFERYPKLGYRVTGTFQSFNKETKKRIQELKARNRADILFLADPNMARQDVSALKAFADNEQLSFFYSSELSPGSAAPLVVHTFSGTPVIEVSKTPLVGWGAIYKRLFDMFGALLLILFTLPLQISVALALAIEQEGPILFRQERIGQRGRAFHYFKFRSMIKNAKTLQFDPAFLATHGNDRKDSPMFKLSHDPRVTRVGKFIRKFSLDEIPEFYLVLLGRMSLVGPRPHMREEVTRYEEQQRQVFAIKPGITGMAQVSGRASLAFADEVALDMYYIENWSPWLDFIILLKTPFVVLLRDGNGKKRFG